MADNLEHLKVTGFTKSGLFKSTLSPRTPEPPQRIRAEHGTKLARDLQYIRNREEALLEARRLADIPEDTGISIALDIATPDALNLQKLEWKKDGIEVLNSHYNESDHTACVVLHVPDGSLSAFEKRVTEYLEKDTRSGKPQHLPLINTIDSFRNTAFNELWTDEREPPQDDNPHWFQLWLRSGDTPQDSYSKFCSHSAKFNLVIEPTYSKFPGRIVVAAYGTKGSLQSAGELLDLVAEIRFTATTSEFFLSDLTPSEQADWVQNLIDRSVITPDDGTTPVISILDTGVNNGHPLINPFLPTSDLIAFDPVWGTTDHHGHGTQMAGIALYGNLVDPLESNDPIYISHKLESIKILPPTGQNAPHLYGTVVAGATESIEDQNPNRNRTISMMTTADPSPSGLPSEWSATIDSLASGQSIENTVIDQEPRLFILSAGNVPWTEWTDYPTSNLLNPIEDPAQAWNALTVGAFTNLDIVDSTKWPSSTPISEAGDLSPSSTTSVRWTRSSWPIKPEVVAEGGNGSYDDKGVAVGPESLRLLTTSLDITSALLTETGDTSAATAEVSRLAALISTRYPGYWPETKRALIVHGARYTSKMRTGLPLNPTRNQKEHLLRRFGYGAINHTNSLNSSNSNPVLVIEDTLRPYYLDGSTVKLNEHNLHALPWPTSELLALGETDVELKITLSYFIAPNPSRRGWQSKFRYQSHGLRFAVKGSTESDSDFAKRINKIERQKGESGLKDPDVAGWFLGFQVRSRGSIHSDTWSGSAADLAEKSDIAIFPVGGWWKDWKDAKGYDQEIRYSLVVSLSITDTSEVDLYTPIKTAIETPVAVDTP